MVGDNQPPASKTGEALQAQLEKLGFKFNYRQVQHPTMLSKFCGVPKAKVAICPNLGWGKDFFDAQSMIDPIFNGKNIVPIEQLQLRAARRSGAQRADGQGRGDSPMPRPARHRRGPTSTRRSTAGAYIIPWLWDNQVNFASTNVVGVANKFNSSWDLSFTSLK